MLATNQESFSSNWLLDDNHEAPRRLPSPLLAGRGHPPLLNRPSLNPPGIITSMIPANEVVTPPTENPVLRETQSPFLRQLMEDIRNADTHEPAPQPQRQSGSGWFGVVTKAVNKADNAVLNIVDRLPSISNANPD